VRTYVNRRHAAHHGRRELYRGALVPCHEVPDRLDRIEAELARRPVGDCVAPVQPAGMRAALERVHTPDYLAFLEGAWHTWSDLDPANVHHDILPSVWPGPGLRRDVAPESFTAQLGRYALDAGTPLMAGTWEAALGGAACTVAAARELGSVHHAFVLTRPPGHHAGAACFGGYCFLNNAALAAEELRAAGAPRVAVLDVDYHHGNGTQSLFYERDDVLTVSLHGDPRTEYPFYLGYADERGRGAGRGCNLNLPLPCGTGFGAWSAALDQAVAAVATFRPEALVVALGVDTFAGDPISGFTLSSSDFSAIGARLAALGLPTLLTLEGGYAVDEVGVNVVNVLAAFGGRCGA